MDVLERLILERVKCRFHPFLSETARWRHYPPHIAELLEDLNLLHVISVADEMVSVDGVSVKDKRPYKEKYSIAKKAVSRLFGEVEEEVCVAGNCEVAIHKSTVASIRLYWGSVWYLAPSIHAKMPRFAYKTDPNHNLFAHERVYDGDYVKCVVLVEEKPEAEVHVSEGFYLDPKPENVKFFGDLCFLAQMCKEWCVDDAVELEVFSPSFSQCADGMETVANVLKCCVGFEGFVSHGCKELLLRGPKDHQTSRWRRLLKLLEG